MIIINGKFLFQRKTGVQRYAYEITQQLIAQGSDIKIVIPKKANVQGSNIPEEFFVRAGIFKNLNLWEQLDVSFYMLKNKTSLLLSLCNTGPLLVANQIVCIHDMSYHENPLWFSKSFYRFYNFLIPKLAKKSLHIITVSNFSKQEICNKLNINTKKVSVVYNAPSKEFILSQPGDISFPKDNYFLFVGSHDPRKNIKLLIKVFSLKEYKNLQLIIIGAPSRSFNDDEHLVNPPNVKFITDCDDQALSNYYKHAKALISSSFYEGFGLSIVEAIAAGCPLILSNIPAFKEIAGSNAFYFDPHSQSSLKIAINNFLKRSDDQLHNTALNNYHKSFNYSWTNSSKNLISIIQNLDHGLN